MTIYDKIFPLGFGTNRFLVKEIGDEEGIERAAALLAAGLDAGISYVDVAHTYSKGTALEACRRAFQRTSAPRYVTIKSTFLTDRTSDDTLCRTEDSLARMGIDHASYFVCWNIASYAQFLEIAKKGGLYDGALRAKERGLIEHICFSTHAPPEDIIKILETGAFEGVTVSFSALNSTIMKPVLDCAEKNNVGVVVMNPLGGGLIPQNQEYYRFLCADEKESVVQAALRYVAAYPAVKVVLSGMSGMEELSENLAAFREADSEPAEARIARVDGAMADVSGFCTGCRYCDGCPQGVNVYELMQAWNTTLFPRPKCQYGRTEPELLETIGICTRLKNTFGFLPENAENPCIGCGRCEAKCTAHLPIIERIEQLYRQFGGAGFSKAAMLARLRDLIADRRRIAFYPGGGYTAYVLELLREAYPDEAFEIFLFDSNAALWGSSAAGTTILPPGDILRISPDMVLVSNYNYADEIFRDLTERLKSNVPIVKLHTERDVPWVF